MKLSPFQMYLRNMIVGPGRFSQLTKEQAYDRLRQITGKDFGFDAQRWREWGEQHPEISGMRPTVSSEQDEE